MKAIVNFMDADFFVKKKKRKYFDIAIQII